MIMDWHLLDLCEIMTVKIFLNAWWKRRLKPNWIL